jgi:membrane associated rhomboid family serine protease
MLYASVDVPMRRPPVANWLLIAVTVAVSFADWAGVTPQRPVGVWKPLPRDFKDIADDPITRHYALQKLQPKEPALGLSREHFAAWQPVTYLFVHGDFWHLLGNMLFLFVFGNAVNAKIGQVPFLAAYLGLGALAGLVSLVFYPGVIGASGAVMGLTGVFLVFYPLNEIAVYTQLSLQLSGDAWRFPSWLYILFYMALDLLGVLVGGQGIAYVAHLTGGLAGAALALGLLAAGLYPPDRGERNLLQVLGFQGDERPRRRTRRSA